MRFYELDSKQSQIVDDAVKHLTQTAGCELRRVSDGFIMERSYHKPTQVDDEKLYAMKEAISKYINTLEAVRMRGFKMIRMWDPSLETRRGLASLLRNEKGIKVLLVGSMLGELRRQAQAFNLDDFRHGFAPALSRGEEPNT